MTPRHITRRSFLRAAGSCAASLALHAAPVVAQSTGARPNIVLIMADDLGYECLGCYGSTSYKTPNLDELARTGVRFDRCYSQPLCTPSRVQLMTGQYNFRNYKAFGIIDPRATSFAHLLKSVGYATCVVGKWQLYGSNTEKTESQAKGSRPDRMGFDEHCLWQVERRESRYRDPVIVENGTYRTDLAGRYGPDVFCEYATGFIERHRDKRFLLYYPMTLTHDPFVPTPDSEDWSARQDKADPKYFADMVAYMDKIVGRVVKKLDDLGLRENTLILFTGDNGTGVRIESKLGGRIVKGGKGKTTDAGTHVPLIANWMGVAPSGRVCDDLIDFTDFLPTLAETTGAPVPMGLVLDGRSFLPQIRGEKGTPREWVFCHFFRDPGNPVKRFAMDKRWKLYQNDNLFDVAADPLEEHPSQASQDSPESGEARKRLRPVLDSLR
ncbi:MAG: sulfatase-like hydrolase/transferase [Phycisphaerales bacterium]